MSLIPRQARISRGQLDPRAEAAAADWRRPAATAPPSLAAPRSAGRRIHCESLLAFLTPRVITAAKQLVAGFRPTRFDADFIEGIAVDLVPLLVQQVSRPTSSVLPLIISPLLPELPQTQLEEQAVN